MPVVLVDGIVYGFGGYESSSKDSWILLELETSDDAMLPSWDPTTTPTAASSVPPNTDSTAYPTFPTTDPTIDPTQDPTSRPTHSPSTTPSETGVDETCTTTTVIILTLTDFTGFTAEDLNSNVTLQSIIADDVTYEAIANLSFSVYGTDRDTFDVEFHNASGDLSIEQTLCATTDATMNH